MNSVTQSGTMSKNRNTAIARSWAEIQDLIGPARCWPVRIRKLFWTRYVRNFQRLLLCAFVYINGLNPLIFIEWCQLKGLLRDMSAKRHIAYLFDKFEEGAYPATYGYNIYNSRYEFLSGRPKSPEL